MGMPGLMLFNEGALLIALGLGYIVCYLANREEKALRQVGFLIGTFIIALSVIMIVNQLLLSARMCNMAAKGFMPHKMMMKGQPQPPIQK